MPMICSLIEHGFLPAFSIDGKVVLSPRPGGSLLGCPCICKEFFLDWMGFDREARRHFLTAFSDKPSLFLWNLVFATVLQEP